EIRPRRHLDTEIAMSIGDCRSSRVAILIEHQNRGVRKRPRTRNAGAADLCRGAFNDMPHNARSIARRSYLGPDRGTPDSHKTYCRDQLHDWLDAPSLACLHLSSPLRGMLAGSDCRRSCLWLCNTRRSRYPRRKAYGAFNWTVAAASKIVTFAGTRSFGK